MRLFDKLTYFVLTICLALGSLKAQNTETLKWYSLEEASTLAKQNNKKILVDVYTEWCGWCKVMDKKTYLNADVIKLLNKYFIVVKMDAESKTPLSYQGISFKYQADKRTNELAWLLLNGKMSYPTTVFMNSKSEILSPVPGYIEPATMIKILKYYGENIYEKMSWEQYEKSGN